jgi:hypothetical protein
MKDNHLFKKTNYFSTYNDVVRRKEFESGSGGLHEALGSSLGE